MYFGLVSAPTGGSLFLTSPGLGGREGKGGGREGGGRGREGEGGVGNNWGTFHLL